MKKMSVPIRVATYSSFGAAGSAFAFMLTPGPHISLLIIAICFVGLAIVCGFIELGRNPNL